MGNTIKYTEMNWYCLKLPRWGVKWCQNNFDVIMILIIWHQDYRNEKGKNGLKIVTVVRMTKLKRIARTILHDKNFLNFFHAFILLLITDNTCILLCTIYSIGPLNESNKERGMKHLCFSIFSRLCNQSIDRFRVIYLWRTKIKRTAW